MLPVILLTATVRPELHKWIFQKDAQSRLNTYLKSFNKWINDTSFNIVIVENSGFSFDLSKCDMERVQVITYDEKLVFPHVSCSASKGQSEVFAINYAFRHSSLLQSSEFIIKVTGRFFIPGFEDYVKTLNLSSMNGLRQNNPDRCEIVGSHRLYFHRIFDVMSVNGHVEHAYKQILDQCDKVVICKDLPIEPTLRGGENEIYKFL